MGHILEQASRHVLLGGGLEIRGEQGQREPVGLVRVALLEIGYPRRQGPARLEPGDEGGRRRAAPAAHAEAPGGVAQRAAMPLHREAAVQPQRLRGHLCHHRGVTVAVAADPRGEGEPAGRRAQAGKVLGQRAREIGAQARQRVPEYRLHEVEPRAHLVGHRGPGGASPVGEPERGDLRSEGSGVGGTLVGQALLVVQPAQELAHPLELGQHRAPLRLGGVGGEHELDVERRQ